MLNAIPFAGTRRSTFARDLGSTAQTTLKVAPHDGHVCSRPTESAGIGTMTPHEQRTELAGEADSLLTSSDIADPVPSSHVGLMPLLGFRIVPQQFLFQMVERLLGAFADLQNVEIPAADCAPPDNRV